jgi:transcriptional regulator with XRE-family HTH domain
MNPNKISSFNHKRLKELGCFIKHFRINRGLSQQELSELSGIHRNTIIKLESINPKNISIITLFEVLDALELCVFELFEDIS